jgi:hypothetical protein
MDLSLVGKPLPAILINCNNQIVIVKVYSSRDNMKSSRYVKRRLKSVRKMRNSRVIALNSKKSSRSFSTTIGLSRNVIDEAWREMVYTHMRVMS